MSAPSCRLCLLNEDLIDMLTERLKSHDILGKIQKYLHLNITDSDGYSTDICMKCLHKIEDFHSFCILVQNNQELLTIAKQILGTTVPIIVKGSQGTPNPVQESTTLRVKKETSDVNNENESVDELMKEIVDTELNESVSSDGFSVKEESRDEMESFDLTNLATMEMEREMDPLDVKSANSKLHPTDFPKIIIHGSKLILRGRELIHEMGRFYDLNCNLCPPDHPPFKCITTLFTHYNETHSVRGYVECCSKKYFTREKMAFHMASHLQPEAFTCSVCNKVMKCPRILRYHQQTHLSESERQWACTSCPRRFCYQSSLTEHLASHQSESEKVAHICPDCGKSFISSGRLLSHKHAVHKLPNEFVCPICGKQFKQRCNFVSHQITHESHANQVQCEQCGKWLKNKFCLYGHMVQHSDIRYKCELCDYSVAKKHYLRSHMRNRHSDNKPFGCEYCDKSFKLKRHLIGHIVQHTGEKKYACIFCDRTFMSGANYYTHRKRMHAKELAEQLTKKEEEEQILRDKCIVKRM